MISYSPNMRREMNLGPGEKRSDYIMENKEYVPYEFNNDGVGGYGSSGRKPLPKEYWDE